MQPIDDAADITLVQIVDAALADSARRSGDLLVCKQGCFQCCVGVFPISQLDAMRLRDALQSTDAARAERIRNRVAESLARIGPDFPGDAATGLLPEFNEAAEISAEAEAFEAAFDDFANNEVCPVLDPATGTCDLYAARPIPCRTFGPPVKNAEGGLGVCELCFHGATDEQIAACEMHPDPEHMEDRLLDELRETTGAHGQTIISYALRS
jgi:Fe-S-cluster containining protein